MSHGEAATGLDIGVMLADRYRIGVRLGEGGMGTVYEAHDTRLDERVALKTLLIGAHGAEQLERFRREVRLARRITHPNVARTHDIGEANGIHFLTMELIVGCSLDDLLEDRLSDTKVHTGPFSASDAVSLCAPIARGLAAAHDAGIIHRDLKPANVMVENCDVHGRVAITDFGVARLVDGDGKRTEGTLGTPIYMAPEQIEGRATGTATDIYSLGIILYEMLTGQLPFEGDTPMAIALARCRVRPTDPRKHVDLNAPLAELILRCLEIQPADRPASASKIADRLSEIAHMTGAHTVMVAPSRPASDTTVTGVSAVSSGSISSPFAPMSPGKRTLAVLPFEFRGPTDLNYLGESLAQELIDTLSRTRGLRVLAYGATSGMGANASPTERASQDPRVIGQGLGADVIVTANVQASSTRVRVSARLTDVQSGVQLWSGRFDKLFEDVFEMQDVVSQRVADELRVELTLIEHQWHATAEATELYLRARKLLVTRNFLGGEEAVVLLERCVALSPRFAPAFSARAIAAMGAWWGEAIGRQSAQWPEKPHTKWAELSKTYVAEALEVAEELAETHLAAAMYALQIGDLRRTATELANTLAIAPTQPEAHRYLADLQSEAGRLKEGWKRARLALELDPSNMAARFCLVRHHALTGRRDDYDREVEKLANSLGPQNTALLVMRVRFALWFDDIASVADLIDHVKLSDEPTQQMMAAFVRYVDGEIDGSILDAVLVFSKGFGNARLSTLAGQLVTEAHAAVNANDAALRTLALTADDALVDVAWLERCPLLAELRKTPEFAAVLTRVRNRANKIWDVTHT